MNTDLRRLPARDKVAPRGSAATRARDHVIERERFRGEGPVTVLATVPVAQHDAFTRYRSIVTRHPAVDEQPDHAGNRYLHPGSLQRMRRRDLDQRRALEHKSYGMTR